MCHFLDACVICNDSLVPLYNTLVSCSVDTEARDTTKNIYCLKLLKDLQDTLVMGYLRQVDKSAALVTMSVMASRETANQTNHAKTTSAAEFFNSLFFDQNGNIIAKLTDVNGNIHNINLVQPIYIV